MKYFLILLFSFNCFAQYERHIDQEEKEIFYIPSKDVWVPVANKNRHYKEIKEWRKNNLEVIVDRSRSKRRCRDILREHFDLKGYSYNGTETCAQLRFALSQR